MFPFLTRDDVFRIETPRLWLRWPRLEDATFMALWVGLPRVATMTSTFKVDMRVGEVRERLEQVRASNIAGRGFAFVMTPKGADASAIGMLGVSVQPGGRMELGYLLDPDHWGAGLMTEAVSALCEQAFDLMPIANIGASTRPENGASIRLLEKCGFKLTGTGEHESAVYGRYPVISYGLARARPSPLLAAQHRRAAGPKVEHELVRLV